MREFLEKIKLNEKGELDESVLTEIEDHLAKIMAEKIDEKSKILAEDISLQVIAEAKDALNEQYEEKYEEYKQMITEKFSDFLDSILEEELQIPADITEFARKGKLYADVIDQFKVRIGIDEGLLNDEASELIREARDEIVSLKESITSLQEEKDAVLTDAKQLSAALYLRNKCDGLTEAQKEKTMRLLEGVYIKEDIDSKFNIIRDTFFLNEDCKKDECDLDPKNKKQVIETICVCPECGRETTITEGACELYNCPDCEDIKLTEKKTEEEIKKEEKKVDESTKVGFDALLDQYTTIVKSKIW